MKESRFKRESITLTAVEVVGGEDILFEWGSVDLTPTSAEAKITFRDRTPEDGPKAEGAFTGSGIRRVTLTLASVADAKELVEVATRVYELMKGGE